MDIIKRNFFRILLSGALGENEALEPMTRFKWNRLVQMIKAQDVVAIAIDGLSHTLTTKATICQATFLMTLHQAMAT